MISSLPDWITAGTAITAVVGGLFGVYSTTQSRLDVSDERMANTIEILERLSEAHSRLDLKSITISERMARSEVSADYLKEGQDRLDASLNTLTGEVRQLNRVIKEERGH